MLSTHAYDAGRLASKTFSRTNQPSDLFTYAYDELGRISSVTQDFGNTGIRDLRTTTTYDDFGRTDVVTTFWATTEDTYADEAAAFVDYNYDDARGLLESVVTTNSHEAYEYDDLGRLTTVRTLEQAGTTTSLTSGIPLTLYTYDAIGNLRQTTTGEENTNGFEAVLASYYQYDTLNRLLHLGHYNATPEQFEQAQAQGEPVELVSYQYTLRADGKRSGVVEERFFDGGTVPHRVTFDWSYDNLGRLVQEDYDRRLVGASVAEDGYTTSYQFDLVGNRLQQDVTGVGQTNSSTTTYIYDNNDRLTSETTGSDTTTYEYGGVGNPWTQQTKKTVGSNVTDSVYNLQGRLQSTASGGTTTSYAYNDNGIRVWQEAGSTETFYLVDESNHTGFAQVREQATGFAGGSDPDSASNGLDVADDFRSLTLGNDVIGQHDAANGTLTFLYDGHGSTRALIEAGVNNNVTVGEVYAGASTELQIFDYDAYGNLINRKDNGMLFTVADARTSILFSGEQTDANGTQYLRARYYDPANGRFNRLDPFAGNSRDPQSLHKYLYANANPVMGIDPSGLFTIVGISSASGISSSLNELTAEVGQHVLTVAADVNEGKSAEQALINSLALSIGVASGGVIFGAIANFFSRGFPLGFRVVDDFTNFGRTLDRGLKQAGYKNADAVLQGSAITGRSFDTGQLFDVGRVSDFDIALTGTDLFNAAKKAGIRNDGLRTGPLDKFMIERLGLTRLRNELSSMAGGRPINFLIFENVQDALERSPSVLFPRG